MKKTISIIIIGLLVSCSFCVQGIFFKDSSEEITKINLGDFLFDKKIEFFMKLSLFPSISACIIKDDNVIWSNGYGYYDIDNKKQATENTIYNIASISKTITGTAIMQLYEKKLFDLDQDVNDFLPFELRNPYFPDEPITFRMLLSHSSSLNSELSDAMRYYQWYNFSGNPPYSFYPYPWLEEHLKPGGKYYYYGRWSRIHPPGEYAQYSNVNFDLIAYLVEIISGLNFIDYCNENIFLPLKMFNTSFNLSELNIDNVAIPYHYHDGTYIFINELNYIYGSYTPTEKYWRSLHYPVGGLYTTVIDLSHFLVAHMNGGVWNGVRILQDESINEMHSIQPPGNTYGDVNFGLAWQIEQHPSVFDINLSGHDGGKPGVFTFMFYIPSENVGVIYFANSDKQYEDDSDMRYFVNMLLSIAFFKKGGCNLIFHIDF